MVRTKNRPTTSTLAAGYFLLALTVGHVVNGQSYLGFIWSRTPHQGSSCTDFSYVLSNRLLPRFLGSFARTPCRQGTVVNSNGICVLPQYSDRCQPKALLTEAYIRQRCSRLTHFRFADSSDCSRYYDCNVGLEPVNCPDGFFYNDVIKNCDTDSNVNCGQREKLVSYSGDELASICQQSPQKLIPRADSCNAFYNCSQGLDPEGRMPLFQGECPYLQLFDATTLSCRDAEDVQCDGRPEVKNPCDLNQFLCGRSSHCRPCWVDRPDCSALPDGINAFPGQEFTPRFANCLKGRSLSVGTCSPVSVNEPRLFDSRVGNCVSARVVPRSLGGLGPDD